LELGPSNRARRDDITTAPMENAPTAHRPVGGVWVRPEDHGTGVEGLYAVGEAAGGLHGEEVDRLKAADGPENVRVLQRAVRDTMTAVCAHGRLMAAEQYAPHDRWCMIELDRPVQQDRSRAS